MPKARQTPRLPGGWQQRGPFVLSRLDGLAPKYHWPLPSHSGSNGLMRARNARHSPLASRIADVLLRRAGAVALCAVVEILTQFEFCLQQSRSLLDGRAAVATAIDFLRFHLLGRCGDVEGDGLCDGHSKRKRGANSANSRCARWCQHAGR